MDELTKRKRLRRRLRELTLDRVDFVPAGANPLSNITLFKAEDVKEATRKPARKSISELRQEVADLKRRHPDLAKEEEGSDTPHWTSVAERVADEMFRAGRYPTREQALEAAGRDPEVARLRVAQFEQDRPVSSAGALRGEVPAG